MDHFFKGFKLKFLISKLGLSIACLLIGVVARMLATYLSGMCMGMNFKEKLFMCFVWIPKATLQVGKFLKNLKNFFKTIFNLGSAWFVCMGYG